MTDNLPVSQILPREVEGEHEKTGVNVVPLEINVIEGRLGQEFRSLGIL